MPRLEPAQLQPGLFEELPVVMKPALPLQPLIRLPTSSGRPEARPPFAPAVEPADDEADGWYRLLVAAFARQDPPDGFLPLAERALAACPGDIDLLLLAANAALIDGRHERALVFLKRFHKRAKSPAAHLLRAFALHLAGLRAASKAMLERHGLGDPLVAFKYYPAGMSQVDWFVNRMNEIKQEERQARSAFARPVYPTGKLATKGRKSGTQERARAGTRSPGSKRGTKVAPTNATSAPVVEATPPPLPLVDIDIPLEFAIDLEPLNLAVARQAPESDGRAFRLRQHLAHLGLVQGFDELLCSANLVGVEPLWHQIETVRKVLKQFRGRVLLADEVGLGKTIEAGMVLKEYALRGMAERALVLTPASLVGQWREELETKFGLTFATTYDPLLREDAAAFWQQPRIVASIATARRREHMEALVARPLDMDLPRFSQEPFALSFGRRGT